MIILLINKLLNKINCFSRIFCSQFPTNFSFNSFYLYLFCCLCILNQLYKNELHYKIELPKHVKVGISFAGI